MILRVLVVSNVGVVREGLYSVLSQQDGIEIVGAVDLIHARDRSAHLQPDVVLFDAGRQGAVDFVQGLVASAPRSKVVPFGVKETEEEILALAAAGTAGYICDTVRSGDVVKVLQRVMCNELTCSPQAAASLYHRVGALSLRRNASADCPLSTVESTVAARDSTMRLSRREMQIAHLIDRGLTNKEIGRQLGIEATTVKNHIHNICEKLGVHRRGEATARIRAILTGQAGSAGGQPTTLVVSGTLAASAPVSFAAPRPVADQSPAARNGTQAGHP